MAPFSNFISFLFLTTLLFSLQINARDSQFFSKVIPLNNNNNNNNVKETQVPNNEGPLNKPEQQQKPVFIPETTGNSYGLYGHESGLNPPSTTSIKAATTTYQPSYKTEAEDNYKMDGYNTNSQNEMSDTRLFETTPYNNNNKDSYGSKQNEFSGTKYTEGGFNSMENNKNHKYYYNSHNNNNGDSDKYLYNNNAASGNYLYNNNNNGDGDKYLYNNNAASDNYFYNNNNNNNNNNGDSDKYLYNNKYKNDERQGISDTRFVEGGKYFYDLNSDKYDPTRYGGSARGVNSQNNWVNNRGYFGANNNDNGNSFQNNKNAMGGYQSEEVFEDDQENLEP